MYHLATSPHPCRGRDESVGLGDLDGDQLVQSAHDVTKAVGELEPEVVISRGMAISSSIPCRAISIRQDLCR